MQKKVKLTFMIIEDGTGCGLMWTFRDGVLSRFDHHQSVEDAVRFAKAMASGLDTHIPVSSVIQKWEYTGFESVEFTGDSLGEIQHLVNTGEFREI